MAQAQMKEFSRRLHVSAAVTSQALEYGRLSEIKCPRGSMSPSCMAAICIELAAVKLGEPLDKKHAQKLSGVQTKVYRNSYQTVEKLLDLCSLLKVRELAVRFGCLEAVPMAEDILRCYRKEMQEEYSAALTKGLDLDKPLYTTAALYYSCKLQKIQSSKVKFMNSSMSSKSVFENVLDKMKNYTPSDGDDVKRKSKKRKLDAEDSGEDDGKAEVQRDRDREAAAKRETLYSRILSNPTSKEYLEWKERTLKQAKMELDNA